MRRLGRRGARRVVRAPEVVDDPVERSPHAHHRACDLVARRSKLLDLLGHRTAALRRIGEHPPSCLLGLIDHRPTVIASTLDERFALCPSGLEDAHGLLLRVLTQRVRLELGLGNSGCRLRLGANLDLGRVRLSLVYKSCRRLLCLLRDPRRFLVSTPQHRRAALAERRAERRLVEHGVTRRILGSCQPFVQLLLAARRGLQLACELLEKVAHLLGVIAAASGPEGAPRDLGRRPARAP